MARRQDTRDPQSQIEVLEKRIADLEKITRRLIAAGTTTLQAIDTDTRLSPQQGEIGIHWPRPTIRYFHEDKWRDIVGTALYEIKITSDDGGTATTDKFIFAIPFELDLWVLARAEAYVTTVGAGITTIDVNNDTTALDMLATHIRIDSGEKTSYTAAIPSVAAATPNNEVHTGDMVHIIVEAVGSGVQGLGVILEFTPS